MVWVQTLFQSLTFLLSISSLLCETPKPVLDKESGFELEPILIRPIRHKKKQASKGTYKTKEEVEKAPSEDHPCNLTRTSVKISFPAMKSELFVNFLGYREPNLMYVMRCKGLCGDSESKTACAATKVTQKKVKMMVKTHFQGRDEKEKWKELILDEHVECGCKCKDMSAAQCAGRFNTLTCVCECEERFYGEQKVMCESRVSKYWDSASCRCMSKSVAPRGADIPQEYDCYGMDGRMGYPHQNNLTMFDIFSYIVLGSSITTAMFLSATTFYYRRKYKQLLRKQKDGTPSQHVEKSVKPPKPMWRHPNKTNQQRNHPTNQAYRNTNGYKMNTAERARSQQHQPANLHLDLHHDLLSPVTGEPFEDQYDEHGVKIEREMDDAELLRHYMG